MTTEFEIKYLACIWFIMFITLSYIQLFMNVTRFLFDSYLKTFVITLFTICFFMSVLILIGSRE